jgi:hypothetical protein
MQTELDYFMTTMIQTCSDSRIEDYHATVSQLPHDWDETDIH